MGEEKVTDLFSGMSGHRNIGVRPDPGLLYEEHDSCYVGCAKSCKGESCRKRCDIALAGHSPFYGYALYGGLGKTAFNAVKEKYKEQCEGCEEL